MISNNCINLYGAVPKIPIGSRDHSLNQNIRQIFDRLIFRLNNKHPIDYRNYISSGSYNLGDHAIAVAVAQQIGMLDDQIVINNAKWGRLEQLVARAPILFAGSGYYFLESPKTPAHRINQDSDFIEREKIGCAYFGVGVNFIGSASKLTLEDIPESGQDALAKSLALATTISVRDVTSKNILQPLTATPIAVTGDPALFIKRDRTVLNKLAPKSSSRTIGINIPFHGPAANARVSKDLKKYIAFFRTLQNDTGCHFIQTVHFQTETFIGKVMQDNGIRLTQAVGDVQTLLNAYQQMDFHIGGMLHSCILSASVGTPCIGLAYDIKHQGFFDLLGQPDLCVPAEPFDPEHLRSACERVIVQNAAIRVQINARRDELETVSNRFLAHTLQALLV
jgi:predicted nucleic acid-binding Zn ribbon protein